eukprot:173827-Pleurochrysis_carterae.AAC.4
MERIALSATPFSWCTWGGHVDVCTPSEARRSVNSRDKNSPALSLCSVPTMRVGDGRPAFSSVLKAAMNFSRVRVQEKELCQPV